MPRNTRSTVDFNKKEDDFLADFLAQSKIYVEAIKEQGDKLKISVKNSLAVQLASLPQDVRKMTVREYKEKHGSLSMVNCEVADDIINGIMNNVPSTEKIKTNTKTKATKKLTSNKQQGNIGKLNVLDTPLQNKRLKRQKVVTPKFDIGSGFIPRTSRRAKPGEILMSVSGSPVVNADKQNDEKSKVIKIHGSKELDLTAIKNLAKKKQTFLHEDMKQTLLDAHKEIENILKQSNS